MGTANCGILIPMALSDVQASMKVAMISISAMAPTSGRMIPSRGGARSRRMLAKPPNSSAVPRPSSSP